jgi:hypothetical protein
VNCSCNQFSFSQKQALQHVFEKEGIKGRWLPCHAKPIRKVKVIEAMVIQVKGYSDLEAKETTNMTGRRRGPVEFQFSWTPI